MSKKKSEDKDRQKQHCSFCGLGVDQVDILVPGPQGNLCDRCAYAVHDALEEALNPNYNKKKKGKSVELPPLELLPKPKDIVAYLDKYVVGQDDAKVTLAVAVYNHYKRLQYKQANIAGGKDLSYLADSEVELEKSNIMMVGPTGTGKTLLARSISKLLHVPFTIVDATVFTQAGYVGEDVESILSRLLQAADYDVSSAEKGIVFIDEIDKIARKSDNPSITRDVSGEGVQQSMLKLLEGTDVNVPPEGGRKHPEQKMVKINTSNILFICGGAFDGIEKRIAKRLNTKVVGYGVENKHKKLGELDLLKYLLPADLKSFGLIPEIVGRVPVLTHLLPLDRNALRMILTEPKNAISKQYKLLMKMDGIDLDISEEVYDFIVDVALEYKLGARGLRGVFERLMREAMFNMPSSQEKRLHIDLEYAKGHIDLTDFKEGYL